ncbi:MAG: hypothetical protein Q9191_006040 [Dirinaria sp. TL-2023a]
MINILSPDEKATILVADTHCAFSLDEMSKALGYHPRPHLQPRYSVDDIRLAWFELKILCHTPTNTFHRNLYKNYAIPYWKLKSKKERDEQKLRLELKMGEIERAVRTTESEQLAAGIRSRLEVEQQRRSKEERTCTQKAKAAYKHVHYVPGDEGVDATMWRKIRL